MCSLRKLLVWPIVSYKEREPFYPGRQIDCSTGDEECSAASMMESLRKLYRRVDPCLNHIEYEEVPSIGRSNVENVCNLYTFFTFGENRVHCD